MKKALLICILSVSCFALRAQCVVNPLYNKAYAPLGDSLPCAIRGYFYETNLYYKFDLNSTNFGFPAGAGLNIVIDSVLFLSSVGMPSGFQYEIFPNKPFYEQGDSGCIRIFGTSNDIVNDYTIDFQLNVHATIPLMGSNSYSFNLSEMNTPDEFGDYLRPHLQLLNPGGNCKSNNIVAYSNLISGIVYLDINENGIFDNIDYTLPNQAVELVSEGRLTFTNPIGKYWIGTTQGNHTIKILGANGYAPFDTTALSISLPNMFDTATNQNFAMYVVDTIIDMEVIVASGFARPGSDFTQFIIINNLGNVAQTTDLNISYDDILTLVRTDVNPINHIDNLLSWNLPLIGPQQQQRIRLDFMVPTNVNLLGRTLTTNTAITYNPNETDTTNNNYTETVTITGPLDPNDKTPYPTDKLDEAFIDSGEPIMYRIRFQNTGTDTAFNIIVRDTLDLTKFDINSIRLIGASNEYTFRIEQNNIAIWEFTNILLPDSNVNEPGSHGFIMFELDLLPGLGHGDVVENRAGIYFDFNPVVLTDYAVSRVDFSSGIIDLAFSSHVTVYPNPAQNQLVVYQEQWQQGSAIALYDLSGKLMLAEPLATQRTELNTSSLPNGIYLYRVTGANGIEGMGKVVVAK